MPGIDAITTALLGPFVDPGSRTFWGGLAAAALLALAVHAVRGELSWRGVVGALRHRSSWLDVQLLIGRQLLRALGALPALGTGWWLATHLVRALDGRVGVPELGWPTWAVTIAYTAVLFVAWDLSRYVVHRLMHEIDVLWAFHQVHHTAEVLTPLTFHRVHPVESVIYGLRGGLITGGVAGVFFWLFREAAVEWTILGVSGVGLLLNAATGNLRHSHAWLRFPAVVERWLVSPAQHQLHHARDGERTNYGTWLAVWDRLGGSLSLSPEQPPAVFGIAPEHRNHDHTLVSAWLMPFRDAARGVWPVAVASAGLLLLAAAASAQDSEDEDGDDDVVVDMEVIVEAEDGKPRVAGSAHVVDEEVLEQFEYDDIHQVLDKVPGVVVRGEDGFGLRPNIGLRGANSDRSAKITLLEDGVLLAPAPYAAPAAYYFPMTTRLVGVEVFKGPAAITHGPHTVGGAINLRTRRPPEGLDGAVDLARGLRSTTKLHGFVGGGTDRWGVLVEGVHLQTDGFKQLDGGGPTGFDRTELMLRARVGTDPALRLWHGLELKLGYAHETSHETYLGLHVDDFEATPYRRYAASALGLMEWDRTQVEVAWPVRLGDVEIRTVAYHHGLQRAWRKFNRFAGGPDVHDLLQQPESGASAVFLAILRGEEDSTTDEETLQIGTNDRRFQSAGVQSRMVWRSGAGPVRHRLEGGLRLHGDRVDRLHTEDPYLMQGGQLVEEGGDTLTLVDSRATALAFAAHVADDLQWRRVHLIPGARVETIVTERDDSDAGTVTRTIGLPGLGVLVEATPELDLFAGAHRGFSPVPPGEPEEVSPEVSWNLEGGARAGRSEGLHGELVAYVNDYVNLTGQCTFSGGCIGDDVDRQFNGGRALVYGLESVLGHELLLPAQLSLPVEATYTLTESRFQTSFVSGFPQFGSVSAGDALPYVPRHAGSARVSIAHPRVRLGAALAARSGMHDFAGPDPVPEDTGVPPLLTLDLALDAQLTELLMFYTTLSNATGAVGPVSWRPFGARPQAPTQLMVGLKLRPGS